MKNKTQIAKGLVTRFESIRGYFYCDTKLCYFINKEAGNSTLHIVSEKVSAIGNPSMWQNGEQKKVAEHIVSLRIDERLKEGDLELVSDLANLDVTFSDYERWRFFSRYCSIHQPDRFPVYSISTQRVLQSYHSVPNVTGMISYKDYWKGINMVINDLDINLPNYFCADKFFWIYEGQLISVLEENKKVIL
ncbi:MAG TPA: hypothetical protein PKJ63_00330 [Cyclobacteriaceae bacterium]|nr:hypothetical protein [Cyclobacteriaceae bacterium]